MVRGMIDLAQGNSCRLRLGFKSLVKFTTLVSFCGGIGGIPICFIIWLAVGYLGNAESIPAHDLPFLILFLLVGLPVISALNGVFFAMFAFPVYRLLSKRIYTGEFELLKIDDAREI
jgi:hypothetical protein